MTLHLCLQCSSLLIWWEKERIVDGCHLCVVSFVLTTQNESSECYVWFQCITQWCCSLFSNLVICWFVENGKVWTVDGCHLCVVSFVLTPQIEFSECCVWFQCITQWFYTCVSNLVPCWFYESRKVYCWQMPLSCCFFYVHHSDKVLWVLCLISMLHSVMLLLCLQSCYLLMVMRNNVNRYHLCVVTFILTIQKEWPKCCVCFQCFSKWCCPCFSDLVPCRFDEKNGKKNELLMDAICIAYIMLTTQTEFSECCVWFQCITQWCCTCVSNLVPCWFDENEKELITDGFHLCAVSFSLQLRSSTMSVVFDFNASLNDFAPVSPILFPVDLTRTEKEWIVDGFHDACFFCVHHTNWVWWVLCLSSMLHLKSLLLHDSSRYLPGTFNTNTRQLLCFEQRTQWIATSDL